MKFLLGSRVVSIRVHLAGNTLRVSKSCQQKQLEEEEMQKIEGNLLSKLELYELLHFLSCFGDVIDIAPSATFSKDLMEALIQKRDDGVAVALVHKLLQFLTPSTCQDKWQGSLRNKVIQHWREYFDQKPDALTARDFSWAQLEPSTRLDALWFLCHMAADDPRIAGEPPSSSSADVAHTVACARPSPSSPPSSPSTSPQSSNPPSPLPPKDTLRLNWMSGPQGASSRFLSLPLGGIDGSYRLLSHPEDDVVTSIDTGDTLEGVRVVATSQKDVAALAEEWRSRPDGTEGRGGAEAVISAAERDARSMENRQAELKCRRAPVGGVLPFSKGRQVTSSRVRGRRRGPAAKQHRRTTRTSLAACEAFEDEDGGPMEPVIWCMPIDRTQKDFLAFPVTRPILDANVRSALDDLDTPPGASTFDDMQDASWRERRALLWASSQLKSKKITEHPKSTMWVSADMGKGFEMLHILDAVYGTGPKHQGGRQFAKDRLVSMPRLALAYVISSALQAEARLTHQASVRCSRLEAQAQKLRASVFSKQDGAGI